MRTEEYKSIEAKIARGDKASIEQRWLYGDKLKNDPTMTHPDGRLKHGAVEKLIRAAESIGAKLSKTEIYYRMQFAAFCPTREEMFNALNIYDSWRSIIATGFPQPQPTCHTNNEGDSAHASSSTRYSEKDDDDNPKRMAKKWHYGNLIPGWWVEDSRLGDMKEEALKELKKASTERATAENKVRKIQAWIDAVDGNEDATWKEGVIAWQKKQGEKVTT